MDTVEIPWMKSVNYDITTASFSNPMPNPEWPSIVTINAESTDRPYDTSITSKYQSRLKKYILQHKHFPAMLVKGGTGSGKTAQVPRILWWYYSHLNYVSDSKNNNSAIIVIMPRRKLVTEAKAFLLLKMGFPKYVLHTIMGNESDIESPASSNKDITEFKKILKQKCVYSRLIYITASMYPKVFDELHDRNYNVISIFDEVHEHGIPTDIAISYCKYKNGPIVLITATPEDDIVDMKQYFHRIITVDIGSLATKFKIEEYEYANESLAFLNGYKPKPGEIGLSIVPTNKGVLRVANGIMANFPELNVYTFSRKFQLNFDAIDMSKGVIIVATPIVESGITINGLKYVYDHGQFLTPQFFRYITLPITKAMMMQRRGRVGRVSDGIYIKMFDAFSLNFRPINYTFVYDFVYAHKLYGINDFYCGPSPDRYLFGLRYYDKVVPPLIDLAKQLVIHQHPPFPDCLKYPIPKSIQAFANMCFEINLYIDKKKHKFNRQLDALDESIEAPPYIKFGNAYRLYIFRGEVIDLPSNMDMYEQRIGIFV